MRTLWMDGRRWRRSSTRLQRAEAAWMALPQFSVGAADVMFLIGVCHHRLRHYDTAVEFYRQAREANRGNNWFITRIGALGGDTGEATARVLDLRESCASRIALAMRHQQA